MCDGYRQTRRLALSVKRMPRLDSEWPPPLQAGIAHHTNSNHSRRQDLVLGPRCMGARGWVWVVLRPSAVSCYLELFGSSWLARGGCVMHVLGSIVAGTDSKKKPNNQSSKKAYCSPGRFLRPVPSDCPAFFLIGPDAIQ